MPVYKFQPQMTPKTTAGGVVAGILGLGMAALTFFVGIFVALALLAVGAAVAAVLTVRHWWLGRRGQPQAGYTRAGRGSAAGGTRGRPGHRADVLEGEYEVVDQPPDQS
ncbi:MAG: hypothetical protein AAGB27_03305 [Pseudomonadota bacterium]